MGPCIWVHVFDDTRVGWSSYVDASRQMAALSAKYNCGQAEQYAKEATDVGASCAIMCVGCSAPPAEMLVVSEDKCCEIEHAGTAIDGAMKGVLVFL